MNDNRPLGKRKTIQFLVIVTILFWATQTLLHQWGFGQTVDFSQDNSQASTAGEAPVANSSEDLTSGDKFVPADTQGAPSGTLELRQEASVFGSDVKLKQVCRWTDADASVFAPLGDLTIAHVKGSPFKSITMDDIRQTLHDAGVNVALINFSGATSCMISRSDAPIDRHQAMDAWIEAQQASAGSDGAAVGNAAEGNAVSGNGGAEMAAPDGAPSASATLAVFREKSDPNVHSLRELLTQDICQRLNISPDAIQLNFTVEDSKVLSLSEPTFKFDIHPTRLFNLGNVAWDVTICTDTANKKLEITAIARAWEDQVVVARPLAYKQIFAETDFTTRRVLVDSLPDQPLLRMDQCVGEQAAQDLHPGVVMTSRLVDPVPLVRAGQLVTVTLVRGSVQIRSVARAMEQGSKGQTIKVRNEVTRDVLDVTVTGPQEASLSGGDDGAQALSLSN
jgi:flagella basal body P-ring formation protein FlgA